MGTGFRGTFVIPWALTEVDGVQGAPGDALTVGSSWRRLGEATRVDGPAELLLLDGSAEESDMRKRAAKTVHRLVGAAMNPEQSVHDQPVEPLIDSGFVLTDGQNSYVATEIATGGGRRPLLMFVDELPPQNQDLWVVRVLAENSSVQTYYEHQPNVICFAADTRIATPEGVKQVQDLSEGDMVLTKDDGPQPICWTGRRRITGARMYAMPHMRPIRIRASALGEYRPEGDLLVSPMHRVLLQGKSAEMLYGESEVLVSARDLLNDRSIAVDYTLREVTYVHLMLERHQILFANGVESESFHPADTSLDVLDPDQRDLLLKLYPSVEHDPETYGGHARRFLSPSEAAVLQHEGGLRH
ncbi:hemolysin-type calcium-binding protein [Actibacterium mucosum KCTC 23349]|uniref:Hemolysin-type calcium-binding protein n=1 Tax=Actibacterium mucosum KCTC 23349 TaxID=1454373 RepID=A0A037ZJU2_9RHOB|nr:Hint domain-containing protein [Actibacterium mucosum]KAJ55106.1 hemolysin-type calcium-binding protein [Actibacterium mucosum KCTC 23349]